MSGQNSAINRLAQLSQIRETTLEASATNAETGETFHGASAVFRLQARYSANTRSGTKEQVNFDLDDPEEVEKFKVSVSRFGGQSMPNRRRPDVTPSETDEKVELEGEALPSSPSSAAPEPVFPRAMVLKIMATQLLASAPDNIFNAITPYMYGYLVGDFQTAGTVSSVATGISMIFQMLFTPIAAQMLDVYGRKTLAVFTAIKAVILVVPLLGAGVVINSGTVPDGADETNAKLGAYLDDGNRHFVQFLFALYWVLGLLSTVTTTSQAIVALGDVCQTQRFRWAAIGMLTGLNGVLSGFAVIGANFSLMICGVIALFIAGISVAWSMVVMPETFSMYGNAEATIPAATASVPVPMSTSSVGFSQSRRSFYPSQLGEKEAAPLVSVDGIPSYTGNTPAAPTTVAISSKASRTPRRRISFYVNPFAGFALLRKSRTSTVALWILFFFLMAEVSASDTLVYYLKITLDFGPTDISYLQMEQAGMSSLLCSVIGPVMARRLSCAHMSMMCSVCLAAALLVLSLANEKLLIYAVVTPLTSLAFIQTPSMITIITKNAATPEEVSLSMSTVASLVALLQAAASFLAAVVFRALPDDYLYVTFIISAAFTVPMFILSVCLGRVAKEEQDEADAAFVSVLN